MNYFNVDAIIVYGFLLVTLLVGLWAGRNVKTIKEYALANSTYGVGVLSMTMLATFITGAQTIGYIGYVFDNGVVPMISTILCRAIVGLFLIARYVSPRIIYFSGCLTMGEIMGRLYGNRVRSLIGFLGVFYCLAFVVLQIIWIGHIGELINIPNKWGMLLAGFFLMVYSARGGMKTIAITDVLQFIAITILLSLAVNILLYKVGGISNMFNKIPSSTFQIIHNPSFKHYLVYSLWAIFPSFIMSFPFVERMLMAKDKRQIVQSQYIGIVYLTVFYILLTLITFAAIALKNMGDVNMPQQGSRVFIYLIKAYFPIGIKGLMGAGLLAAVMSTADSFLHSAGMLVANDIIKPLLTRRDRMIDILKVSQYVTFFLGLISLLIALTHNILPQIQYGNMDLGKGINILRDFVAIVFTIPLIAGIMGLKTDAKSFFASFILTIISFFIGKPLIPNLYFIPFNITVNALSFFGAHLIQNKGFVTVKHEIARLA